MAQPQTVLQQQQELNISNHSMRKALDVFHGHRPGWKETHLSSQVIWIKDANIGQRELQQLHYNLSTDAFHSVELLNCKGDAETYLKMCLQHGIQNVSIHDRHRPSDFGHRAIAAIGEAILQDPERVNLRKISLRINVLNCDLEQNHKIKLAWDTFLAGLKRASLRSVSFCPHDPWEPKMDARYVEQLTEALDGDNLESLDIFQCHISKTSYRHLMSLRNLKSLTICDSTQHARSVPEFLRNLPDMPFLKTLRLPSIDDDSKKRSWIRNCLLRSLQDTETRMGNTSLCHVAIGSSETYDNDDSIRFYLELNNYTSCRSPLVSVMRSNQWLELLQDIQQSEMDPKFHASAVYYLVRRSVGLMK